MGRGFDGVREAAVDIEARKAAGGSGGNFVYFKLPESGDSAVVRFLEQGDDIAWAWVCQTEPTPDRKWGRTIVTRDQNRDGSEPCPLIEAGLKTQFRGWVNVIWRNGPIYDRDQEGRMVKDPKTNQPKIIGLGDVVAVWQAGITVFEQLAVIDSTYKGLMSRDFRITRMGTGLNTKYTIIPADPDAGPVPMTDEDRVLMEGKPDLAQFTEPLPYNEIQRLMRGETGQRVPQAGAEEWNPFLRARS